MRAGCRQAGIAIGSAKPSPKFDSTPTRFAAAAWSPRAKDNNASSVHERLQVLSPELCLALLIFAIALGARYLLDYVVPERLPFITFFPAVLVGRLLLRPRAFDSRCCCSRRSAERIWSDLRARARSFYIASFLLFVALAGVNVALVHILITTLDGAPGARSAARHDQSRAQAPHQEPVRDRKLDLPANHQARHNDRRHVPRGERAHHGDRLGSRLADRDGERMAADLHALTAALVTRLRPSLAPQDRRAAHAIAGRRWPRPLPSCCTSSRPTR